MKIFVINLESEQSRMQKIKQQLDSLGLEFERFPAVMGRELTQSQISELYDPQKAVQELGRELRLAEIGCSASHMAIYRKIVDENIPISLIIEDDAIISPQIKALLTEIEGATTKTNWEYLSLNYTLFDWKTLRDFRVYAYQNFFQKYKFFQAIIHWSWGLFYAVLDWLLLMMAKVRGGGFMHIPAYKPMYLTGGYLITLQGAKKLLNIHTKLFLPADVFVEYARKRAGLKFYVQVPMLIRQDANLESSVQVKK